MKHMEEELVSFPFGDSKIDALFYRTTKVDKDMPKEPIVIHVHGFLGNFLQGSQRFLPPILAKAGYSSLAINTRMANFGLFFGYGLLDDTVPQIDATVEYLKNLGYANILISGYSLGGSIALRYAALRKDQAEEMNLKGVIILATPYSMPDSIRRRWDKWGSQPTYEKVYKEAKGILRQDPENASEDRTIIIFKARGDTYLPQDTEIYTYKTWWSLAGPEAEAAKGYEQIVNIEVPILIIQGWYDDIVDSREAYELAQTALDAGNKDVSVFYVNTGHTLEGKEEELGGIIIQWISRRFINSNT